MDADEIILERLAFVRNEVAYLKRERDQIRSFKEYVDNTRLRRAVERGLQVAVEACLDIGRRLIRTFVQMPFLGRIISVGEDMTYKPACAKIVST